MDKNLISSGGTVRTYDPVVNSHLLCLLSYTGMCGVIIHHMALDVY